MRPLAFFERIYMSQTREGIRVALDRKKYLSLSQDEAEAIDQEILKLIKESTGNIKALIGSVIKIEDEEHEFLVTPKLGIDILRLSGLIGGVYGLEVLGKDLIEIEEDQF